MPPELPLLLVKFALLAITIVVAGTYLSHFADAVADLTGVGRTLGGLLLLASATSLPELAVDCQAAAMGEADIAVGAVLGSSIFNLLILGVLDLLFCRSGTRIISPGSAAHALSAVGTILLSSIVLAFIALKQFDLELMNVGLGTLLAFLFYIFCLRLVYLDQLERTESEEEEAGVSMTMRTALIGYVTTTAVILIAAAYMAPVAKDLAVVTKLGGTFIGSTLVALTTSLPEVVTTTVAIRMGAYDMAVGNILGSNLFNMAILFPVDLFYRTGSKSLLRDAELSNLVTGSAVVVVTSVMLLALLGPKAHRRSVFNPGPGLVVFIAFAAFVALYYLTPAAL